MADMVEIDGPALVFGGCYSNLEATRALLDAARRRGVRAENTVCTGDVVAYCADAAATVDLVRSAGIRVIAGNCEESLGEGADDCGCGFDEGSLCDRLSVEWYGLASRSLDDDHRAWMRGLPRRLDLAIGGLRLAVVHAAASSINRFIFASTPLAAKREELNALDCDGVLSGHSGLPFTQVIDGRLWHNAGAIGMPANDGTPRTWYSLLTPTADGMFVEHVALDYDFATAAAKMERAGLAGGYAQCLRDGLWPSCDVLPADERAARGRRLAAGRRQWRVARAPA